MNLRGYSRTEFLFKTNANETLFFQRDILAKKIIDRIENVDGEIVYSSTRKKKNPNGLNAKEIKVTSSEYLTSKLLTSRILVKDKEYKSSRGLNLFYFDIISNNYSFTRFDTYREKNKIPKFIKKIEELNEKSIPWIIAVHDAVRNYPEFKPQLKKLGLKKLSGLDGRIAYIAYNRNGKVSEFSSKKSLSLLLNGDKAKILKTESMTATQSKVSPSQIQLISSEFTTAKQIKSQIKVGEKVHNLQRGLNLLIFKNDKGTHIVEHFDTYRNKETQKGFLQRIEHLNSQGKFWAVASHDALKMAPEFKAIIESLGFKKLPKLNGRIAYVAYMTKKGIEESTAKKSISVVIDAPAKFIYINQSVNNVEGSSLIQSPHFEDYRDDTSRYIARGTVKFN